MARMVTGSVADNVAPTDMASTKEMSSPSSGIRVQRYKIRPSTRAEIKVPANAKVRMVPIFRKKLPCCRCVSWLSNSFWAYLVPVPVYIDTSGFLRV